MMDLEPIKTALTAGDYAGARRARLLLMRAILDELLSPARFCDPYYEDQSIGCREVIQELDAMYIPEEP